MFMNQRSYIIKIIPILVCRFSVIPIRISHGFLVEIDILILKFIWNCKEPKIVKTTFEKKHKNEILTLSNLLCTYGNQECMVLAH